MNEPFPNVPPPERFDLLRERARVRNAAHDQYEQTYLSAQMESKALTVHFPAGTSEETMKRVVDFIASAYRTAHLPLPALSVDLWIKVEDDTP